MIDDVRTYVRYRTGDGSDVFQCHKCQERMEYHKNTVSPNSQTVASFNENISAFKKIYVPAHLSISFGHQ